MSNNKSNSSLAYWIDFIDSYKCNLSYLDDIFALETCKLALKAVRSGNYGIGSIIVDPHGQIITKGHNEVFSPYFRSDRHAEMVVMEVFEETHKEQIDLKGYTLYTSLESCPMCMTRLISSGIEKIIHVADDPNGGMVHLRDNLPIAWKQLSENQTFSQADCSFSLKDASFNIFSLNRKNLSECIRSRCTENY
jgi:cytosine deaminase